MSAAIFGGASQMVGIELFGQKIAPWLIVLSIFAVNFRHVLYSAAIGRRISHWPAAQQAIAYLLPDRPAICRGRAQGRGRRRVSVSSGIIGMALPIYVPWVAESWLGATFGNLIPDPHALGIDFLLPIYFLGLVMEFRDRPLWLPVVVVSAVASVIAYNTVGSPWHVSIGAVAGILLAAVLPPRRPATRRSQPGAPSNEHDALDHPVGRGRHLSDPRRRPSGAVALRAHPSARRGRAERRAGGGADDAGRARRRIGRSGRADRAWRRRPGRAARRHDCDVPDRRAWC